MAGFSWDVRSLHVDEAPPAPNVFLDGTNVDSGVVAFDDSIEQYRNGRLVAPTDLDGSGTVTFRAYVFAATAVASRFVRLRFGHSAKGDSDAWDTAYTDEDSADIAVDANQGDVTEATWTETVSNLGWSANDVIDFQLSRVAPSGTNLTGDLYVLTFEIEIPLT